MLYEELDILSLDAILCDVEKEDLINQITILFNSACQYAGNNYSAYQWAIDMTHEYDPNIPRDLTWPEAMQAALIYTFINSVRTN